MPRTVPKLVLLFALFALANASAEHKHRTKRKVMFGPSSKFFFRLNGKDNMFNFTNIFAHGWSFRINYDLPETIPKRHQFFKRDVRAELGTSADESVQGIYSCVLKYVCEAIKAVKTADRCGIFCGIGNIIASAATMEAQFFRNFTANCAYHTHHCPYNIQQYVGNEINKYI